ncbi:LEAF RUST 10 DISEASE-RESISTANCE LOCUS RECEPTOR-LIKE PROTEIN KINASE-like 1.1 [Vicia villosa]|uniref:LEAF RUST 10 DISEASE-RESISTANCE LOCUS RECEPTOR-LIKE PROTEIN KINASE-like 1.1 n=1 Tax=Vicia villosa TaxID=3911 RepID=UPI00273AFC55|nr:LEAF RUST 10 DISEASE-RESISTANCE LOCUS RECEPTOR-LIKE PROTEIN KINASE-like 1.1 [Vicia villosa]
MATYFVFSFLLLLSHFLFLLSAASEWKYQAECATGEYTGCGNLEKIVFPFTTVNKSECGFYISGCDNNSTSQKKIQIRGHSYIIDSINYKESSAIIYGPIIDGPIIYGPSSSKFSFNTINTFYACKHDDYDDRHENMFKNKSCSDYDIYFTSKSDHPISLNFPLPCFHVSLFPLTDCAYLSSTLEIKVDLEFCKGCFTAGGLCLPDQENLSFECVPSSDRKQRHMKAAVIGLSIGLATVIAIALTLIIWLLYYRRIKSSGLKNQSRANYRGLSRNTTIESGAVYFGIPVFSYEELQKATDNFNQARELGEGGFGTVYYGKLGDGREVAVKRLFERSYRPVESFTNEIQILTRMRHRNLVSLYGCTSRHSRELLLVYEYIPNGTVNSHLHDKKENQSSSLPWAVRMKIAIETAGALTYLHASDVIHRDVKTSNILLDNSFCVKVADFGLSRLYPNDVTHVSTAPRGTPGYVDPEYRLCYQLTSKSDVYSFGVVLVELISSLPAVDFSRDRDDIKLANLAIRKIQKREFSELIDPSLGFQTDENLKNVISCVAELAFQCLQDEKELRPSMSEVLEVLQKIESGKSEAENHEGIDFHHGVGVAQSYAHPSLPNTWMKPQRHQQTL